MLSSFTVPCAQIQITISTIYVYTVIHPGSWLPTDNTTLHVLQALPTLYLLRVYQYMLFFILLVQYNTQALVLFNRGDHGTISLESY